MNSSQPGSSKTCRLIYKSRTSWDLLSNEVLLELARTSADKNAERDITGLLILSGESFLQVLEGPPDEVNDLYLRIAHDERHGKLRLLRYESISRRSFKDWAMHVVDLDDLPMPQRQVLIRKYPVEEGSIVIPDDDHLALALLLDARRLTVSETERPSGSA
ncbi:BLUF domain-containing protein [Haloferula sp. A504]|uniref:BLUF domain-containing protein n=1 Tax=Haloferula sp. A504 TaxID=3373601 RepID=UPI0031C611C7|nr:BLUF domain-containing protein [Verrucomicrobiaceae bacterium E54]